jgi:hypothetical protein
MVRTCQNSLGQNGTRLGSLLLLVGPNGDGFGGQAFMEHYIGPAVPLACRYSVYAGPDLVCSSSSYLPSHQHLLLDLSPFRYS